MANLKENPTWEAGIYQLEETDPVQGGENGVDNLPAKQLANRTVFLKDGLDGNTKDIADLKEFAAKADNELLETTAKATTADERSIEALEMAKNAQTVANSVQLGSKIYPTVAEGLAATKDGEYFNVLAPDDRDYVIVYLNKVGKAVEIKRYPSSLSIDEIRQDINLKSNGLASMIAFSPAAAFDDMNFTHLDNQGVMINDPSILNFLYKNSGDLNKAPFCAFDDEEPYIIIDEKGHILLQQQFDDEGPMIWKGSIHINHDAAKKSIEVAWLHDDYWMLKVVWCPNGHNNLFNFKAIYKAEIGDPMSASWDLVQQVTTDYIPPITFLATTGATSPSGTVTTGGNHGTDGGTGQQTALMTNCQFFIGNEKLTKDMVGFIDNLTVRWTNHLYAGNTVNEKRFCIEQKLAANFYCRGVEILCETKILEPVEIFTDGGTQLVGNGWFDGAHFYGGKQKGMVVVNQDEKNFNAGSKIDNPSCWANVLKNNSIGFVAAWVDRNYGSKTRFVADDEPLAFKNNTSYKFYNFIIKSAKNPVKFDTHESYVWRGGYAYAPIGLVNNLDSAFLFQKGKKHHIGIANTENNTGFINLPANLTGVEFNGIEAMADSIKIDSNEYIANYFKEA